VSIYDSAEKYSANVDDIRGKIEVILGDISDRNLLKESVIGKESIFLLAGQVSHIKSMEDPFLDLELNCRSTLNVLESCRSDNPGANIVFSGTVREAGPMKDTYAREGQREEPSSIYDIHKLTSEKYLQVYNKVYGLRTTCLRLTNVFGPGNLETHPERSVINHFIKKAISDRKLKVYGDGGPLRDYNYVDNVADAFIVASQSEKTKGEFYVIGSGEGKRFSDFLSTLEKELRTFGVGIEIEKVPTPKTVEMTVQGDLIADYGKFSVYSGWKPKVSFEEGVRKTIEYYRGVR
jgi:nucleoside-diphosphate-sugar epimerase